MNELFVDSAAFLQQISEQINAEPAGLPDPHLSAQWFELLAKTAMPEGVELALANVGAASFLPLMRRADQPARLLALSNFYTPLFGIINESRVDPFKLSALAAALGKRRINIHEARFAPMDPLSRSAALLHDAFSGSGWLVDDYFCFGNWYYQVEGKCYQTYLAERPSRLRNTIERAQRKLARSEGFSLEIVQDGERLERAITDFVVVYNQSWKTAEPFPDFIPGLCKLAARMGWLRLGVARLQGQPIAAQLWLVAAGKAHIVKLAYDGKFAKTSAGTVLTAALIRHVIDTDAVDEIDYLIGDDTYKQDWMTQRRERRGIIAFNPRFMHGLGAMLWHKGGKLWRRLRSLRFR